MNWHDKKILVLGLGDTGLSVVRWAARAGCRIRIADTRAAPPGLAELARDHADAVAVCGPFTDAPFRDAELVVASPGVAVAGPACDPAIARAKAAGTPVIGDVELFSRLLEEQGRPGKVIGITGSNGKSTVTAMTGALCRAAGLRTVVAGNIGLPVLDALAQSEQQADMPQAWVLELSSFQLETVSTLRLDAATMLNLSQDHLDRYAGMQDYAAAKQRIFANATVQVLNREDAASLAMRRAEAGTLTFGLDPAPTEDDFGLDAQGGLCRGGERILAMDELPVPGLHNAANALAAMALGAAIGLKPEAMAQGLREFRGLPHRTELVGEQAGVRYLDDSKGTNVGSTVAALKGMTRPVVLIAGGVGKGQDFSPLADPVRAHARAVVLIGEDAPRLAAALAGTGVPLLSAGSMQEAVQAAARAALPGDLVLLSPACASFDMFNNYKHRGEVFAQCVAALGMTTPGAKSERGVH